MTERNHPAGQPARTPSPEAPEPAPAPGTERAEEALAALRRPRLLVRTARFALDDYRRERDLPRLLPLAGITAPPRTVGLLLAAEAACETARTAGAATYSAARHIEILTALMAEARLGAAPAAAAVAVAAAAAAPQAKASGIAALRRAT